MWFSIIGSLAVMGLAMAVWSVTLRGDSLQLGFEAVDFCLLAYNGG